MILLSILRSIALSIVLQSATVPGSVAAGQGPVSATSTAPDKDEPQDEPDLRPRLSRSQGVSYEFEGVLREYLDAISVNWLRGASERNPVMLRMFAERNLEPPPVVPEFIGEFAGKYLAGAAQIAALTNDDALNDYLRGFVSRLIALQGDDGYLGPFPKTYQLTGKAPVHPYKTPTWDGWGHYHVMLGLLLWYQHSGDEQALIAASRIGDLLANTFLGKPERTIGMNMGNYRVNLSPFHSLCLLYQETKNQRYLQLARQIVTHEFTNTKQLDGSPGNRYMRDALGGKKYYQFPEPRWECLHTIQGLAALYEITGEEKYGKAFEHLWWSIAEHDRHNTGGFGSAEQAQGNPYHTGAIETCATTGWSAMGVDMLRLTGNSIVADELELTLMNAVFGSQSRDGRWSTYNTPMDSNRSPNTTILVWQQKHLTGGSQLNCCSMHAPRGFGTLNDWALMTDGQGLVLNWYGPCRMKAEVGGVAIALIQQTDYPRTGMIRLKVSPSESVTFPLKLRVPHWSEKARVRVNGNSIGEISPGRYLVIDRQWQREDTVEIELDMSLHFWAGEQHLKGKVSIYRGPMLLAYDTKKNERPEQMPTFDAKNMNGRLMEAQAVPDAIVAMEFEDVHGAKVQLVDFDSAGEKGKYYVSWLNVLNVGKTPFSKRNPWRSGRVEK